MRGGYPWSELELIFKRMSHSTESVEDFRSFLNSHSQQEKWCTVLPFNRGKAVLGGSEGIIEEHEEVVLFIIPLSGALHVCISP